VLEAYQFLTINYGGFPLRFKYVVSLLIFALLSGCASVSQQAFQRPSDKPLKKIAFIKIPEPPIYYAMDWGNPGMMFGAIGGAIAGAQINAETKQFNDMVSSTGQLKAEIFYDRLSSDLQRLGYEIIPVEVPREEPGKLLESYDGLSQSNADAILDVVIAPMGIGYSTVNLFERDFRPDVRINVNLISRYSKGVLYAKSFMYGYHNPFMSATDLDAPESYFFKDFDTLMANKDKSIEGLKLGLTTVADQIATDLK
jgi:hypothetical protein